MRAVAIVPDGAEGAYDLREDVPRPAIGPRELLVRVPRRRSTVPTPRSAPAATARRRPRARACRSPGWRRPARSSPSAPTVRTRRVDERVMGMCAGGFAEYVALDERLALPVPDALDWAQAAATPVALLTEHDAIATRAGLLAGESLLVQGAGSAVGLMGVQIAKLLGAAPLLATTTSAAKLPLLRELGADVAIDASAQDVEALVAERTAAGADVVIDHVGGAALPANLRALAVGGRLVSVGRLGALTGEADLDLLARKNALLIGASFRTRTLEQYGEIARRAAGALLPALADGRLRPLVDSVFPLAQAEAAQRRMHDGARAGKVVLDLGGS